jgi:hypothetical protein
VVGAAAAGPHLSRRLTHLREDGVYIVGHRH